MNTEVVVVIGAGGIGMAIARHQGFGKHILLADFNEACWRIDGGVISAMLAGLLPTP